MGGERMEVTRQKADGTIETVRYEGGQQTIYRTDNEGGYILREIENLIADFEIGEKVKAKVEPQGDRWFRIEISFATDTPEDIWMDIGTCFDVAFSKCGKHWYETREEGQYQPEGHKVFWWVVQHRDGAPWL